MPVIGYPDHNGENQRWIFTYTQNAWTIKSAALDLYIAPSASSATNGTALQALSTPFVWDIWHDETNFNAYRSVYFLSGMWLGLSDNQSDSLFPIPPLTGIWQPSVTRLLETPSRPGKSTSTAGLGKPGPSRVRKFIIINILNIYSIPLAWGFHEAPIM